MGEGIAFGSIRTLFPLLSTLTLSSHWEAITEPIVTTTALQLTFFCRRRCFYTLAALIKQTLSFKLQAFDCVCKPAGLLERGSVLILSLALSLSL